MTDPTSIDIDTVLRERRQIAHIWGIEDVQACRPDLSDADAWTVLQQVERQLDSDLGITWKTIQWTAEDLFPAPSDPSPSSLRNQGDIP